MFIKYIRLKRRCMIGLSAAFVLVFLASGIAFAEEAARDTEDEEGIGALSPIMVGGVVIGALGAVAFAAEALTDDDSDVVPQHHTSSHHTSSHHTSSHHPTTGH
ncbi:MAG: hypothetical protein R6U50_02660 [Desulfobacterales bacterium]